MRNIWLPAVKYISTHALQSTHGPYPVDEESLCELDHLQSDQQADGDQVVVQDDERQQVIRKVSGDVTCTNTHYSLLYRPLYCVRIHPNSALL